MSQLINMPLTALAILALTACAASEAPAAEPTAEQGSDVADDASDDAGEGAMDASKPAEDAMLAGQRQRITIRGFECGDNCYLEYSLAAPAGGEPAPDETRSALCSVDACIAWFEEQEMPPELIGRSATVTLGLGEQYDNEGNVMSDDFPLVTSIRIDPAE